MGCDIHLYAEKRVDGEWVSADAWEPNEDYPEESRRRVEVDYGKRFYKEGRDYALFGILAGVRCGNREPIAAPRGMPEDASSEVRAECDVWASDGHTHSWLTVAEIMAYDWTSPNTYTVWVNGPSYRAWDGWRRNAGDPPDPYLDWEPTRGVIVDEAEMRNRIDSLLQGEGDGCSRVHDTLTRVFCPVQFDEPAYVVGKNFLGTTVPRLWRLGAPDDVRIVFWFDN